MASSVIQMVIEDTLPDCLIHWVDDVNTAKVVVLIYIGTKAKALEKTLPSVFEKKTKNTLSNMAEAM